MNGPYKLEINIIDSLISDCKIGNFVLGEMSHNREFIPKYIGRSDSDLKNELKKWIGIYNHFTFLISYSVKGSFKQECRDYHSCKGFMVIDNTIHPQRPYDQDWDCPICSIFDKLK